MFQKRMKKYIGTFKNTAKTQILIFAINRYPEEALRKHEKEYGCKK